MLLIASLRRQLPKIQLCLPTADRFRPILFVASASPYTQTQPKNRPYVFSNATPHGNDVAKWQRLTKANSRPQASVLSRLANDGLGSRRLNIFRKHRLKNKQTRIIRNT